MPRQRTESKPDGVGAIRNRTTRPRRYGILDIVIVPQDARICSVSHYITNKRFLQYYQSHNAFHTNNGNRGAVSLAHNRSFGYNLYRHRRAKEKILPEKRARQI